MANRREQLISSIHDKEARAEFVEAHVAAGLAFQIRAMRRIRNWSQADLAARMGMHQETIARLENPDNGAWTVKTLRRLAAAFDVALIVRFEPFERLVDHVVNLSPDDLEIGPYQP